MAGSNNWILDFWDMRFFTKDHLHMNIQYLDVSLQLVRPWECQKLNPAGILYISCRCFPGFFTHIECPEVSEYPSFSKSTACIKAVCVSTEKVARWHGKMWHEVFSRPWCALASCQWGKRMEDMMDVALCFTNIWNIFIENHNFDDELRMFNVFHPDDPIAFLACNLYLPCGL